MKTTTQTETSHSLSFMGVCPPEEFRCRIYSVEPRYMTATEARAWLIADVTKEGKEGTYAPRGDGWDALVDELCADGTAHLYHGRLYLGADFKRPGE